MAVDMFIKIDDIKGESVDDKHKGEIDVLAWSWGMSQSGSAHIGGGAGSGKVQVRDLTLTKHVDKATPILMKYCCNGKHIKEALLTVRKAGGKPVEYLKITMNDAIVSQVSTGGSGGQDRLTEELSLNFAKVKCEYVPQKADGSAEAAIAMGYDIGANKDTA
jgi:type VI secretion system secreted protein Hcp